MSHDHHCDDQFSQYAEDKQRGKCIFEYAYYSYSPRDSFILYFFLFFLRSHQGQLAFCLSLHKSNLKTCGCQWVTRSFFVFSVNSINDAKIAVTPQYLLSDSPVSSFLPLSGRCDLSASSTAWFLLRQFHGPQTSSWQSVTVLLCLLKLVARIASKISRILKMVFGSNFIIKSIYTSSGPNDFPVCDIDLGSHLMRSRANYLAFPHLSFFIRKIEFIIPTLQVTLKTIKDNIWMRHLTPYLARSRCLNFYVRSNHLQMQFSLLRTSWIGAVLSVSTF